MPKLIWDVKQPWIKKNDEKITSFHRPFLTPQTDT
jgi:hypothetical protein